MRTTAFAIIVALVGSGCSDTQPLPPELPPLSQTLPGLPKQRLVPLRSEETLGLFDESGQDTSTVHAGDSVSVKYSFRLPKDWKAASDNALSQPENSRIRINLGVIRKGKFITGVSFVEVPKIDKSGTHTIERSIQVPNKPVGEWVIQAAVLQPEDNPSTKLCESTFTLESDDSPSSK